MSANGLQSFSLHQQETPHVTRSLVPAVAAGLPRNGSDEKAVAALDPESAARRYVDEALARKDIPNFIRPEADGHLCDFKTLGTETLALTGTKTVKFRQVFQRVPVYGSLVTVELNDDNELVSLSSSLGTPEQLNPVAQVSPAQVLEVVRQHAKSATPIDSIPSPYFYFDQPKGKWRFVYITPNVLKAGTDGAGGKAGAPQLFDYVVDAYSGELVAELPRTQSNVAVPMTEPLRPIGRWRRSPLEEEEETLAELAEEAVDGLGKRRKFNCRTVGNIKHLVDEQLNVHTFDFGFKDLETGMEKLPGEYVVLPPRPWPDAGVSAHANAVEVALFLREVMKRDNLDGRGGPIVSTINCVEEAGSGKEWHNAAWIGTQMVYGQRKQGAKLRSYAVALDVVAHEFFHGLTDHTSRLVYAGMSGALNESYSDIFGIILSNLGERDLERWNWQLGEELDETGIPIRDVRQPRLHGQPDHMKDYLLLEPTAAQDWGGVHINSGIHNKAAYELLTAKDAHGDFIFNPRTVAAFYYLALTQHLSRTSTFANSRRGVELAARTLLRRDPFQKAKLDAVGRAFDAVGITAEPEKTPAVQS